MFYEKNNIRLNLIRYSFIKIISVVILVLFTCQLYSSQSYFSRQQNDSIALKNYLDSVRKYRNSNYNKAYEFAIEGLSKFKPSNNIIDRIRLLQLTANIEYYFKNDFNNSILHLNEMRYLSDSIGYERGLSLTQLNLGNVYYYQKDFAKSMELYNSAIKNAKTIGDSIIIYGALTGIADILLNNEKYDSALSYMHQILAYAKRNEILELQFLIYDDIANMNMVKGNYDSSLFYYNKTLEVSKKYKNNFGILCTEVNLNYVNFLKDKSYDAIPPLEELQIKCKKEGFMRLYYEIGYTIAEILEYNKEYEKSLVLYKITRELEDSITANEKIRKVAETESEYYLQKKEFENRELQRINEINSLKLKNRLIFIFFTVFILIQAIILLYIIYRKYLTIKDQERKIFDQERQLLKKEKEAIEHKLVSQERELTGKVMKIYHHNQLIQKMIKEIKDTKILLKIKDNDMDVVNRKLQSMINQLKLSSNNQMWNEFEKSFIETNPEFLEKLSDKYPELTSNEIKLCMFLFLNFRTKDISIITQQSIKSINVARTRLRKKLHLDNTNTNLSVFLKHI